MRVARRLFGALAFGVLFVSGYALAATTSISLTAQGPQPATVTVDWGDTVVFSNGDTVPRAVTSARAEMASGSLDPGGAFEHRFLGRAGRYSFVQTGTRPQTSGVVVLALRGRVTLVTSKAVVPYGSIVTLSGRSSYAETPVVVQLRLAGSSGDWKPVVTRTADADGSYSGRLRLAAGGRIRARVAADQISSEIKDLAVQPRIASRVRPSRARPGAKVAVSARILPAGAATSVDLESYDPERKSWVRESTKSVSKRGLVTFSFKAVKGRTRLRISLRRSGLEPGFVATLSRTMVVVGA